jgi:hypothetical protein
LLRELDNGVMDIETEMELRDAIFHGGVGMPVGVQVTLASDWFSIRNMRNKKPSVRQAAKYWAEMQKPEDSLSMSNQLFLVKRAMLEWPKMGAAIAKLAQKEFLLAKKEAKAHKRREFNKYKKMLRDPVPVMLDFVQADRAADRDNLIPKNPSARCRSGKKVIKK